MRRYLLVGVFVLVAWSLPSPAEACSCRAGQSACEVLWTSGAIFIGRVDSITPLPAGSGRQGPLFARRRVTLQVVEAFHNIQGAEVEVYTGAGGGDCGFRFQTGSVYFIDATRNEGRLTVSSCSMTRLASQAEATIAYARAAFIRNVPLGRVSGTVTFVNRNLDGRPEPRRPAPNIPVVLERDGATWTATTGRDGRFALEGLQDGTYAVRVDLPDTRFALLPMRDITLHDARGCVDASASIAHDGRIRGRVVDAKGRGLPGVTLDLSGQVVERPGMRVVSKADGSYEFARVPAGSFVVGVHSERVDTALPPLPRIFHPGVTRADRAARVRLGGGEHKTLPDFVVPAAARPIVLTGIVVHPDGGPAPGVRVFLKGAAEPDFIIGEPVVTDPEGRFAITAFEGAEYRVFAEDDDGGRGRVRSVSDSVPVAPSASQPPIKLELRIRY